MNISISFTHYSPTRLSNPRGPSIQELTPTPTQPLQDMEPQGMLTYPSQNEPIEAETDPQPPSSELHNQKTQPDQNLVNGTQPPPQTGRTSRVSNPLAIGNDGNMIGHSFGVSSNHGKVEENRTGLGRDPSRNTHTQTEVGGFMNSQRVGSSPDQRGHYGQSSTTQTSHPNPRRPALKKRPSVFLTNIYTDSELDTSMEDTSPTARASSKSTTRHSNADTGRIRNFSNHQKTKLGGTKTGLVEEGQTENDTNPKFWPSYIKPSKGTHSTVPVQNSLYLNQPSRMGYPNQFMEHLAPSQFNGNSQIYFYPQSQIAPVRAPPSHVTSCVYPPSGYPPSNDVTPTFPDDGYPRGQFPTSSFPPLGYPSTKQPGYNMPGSQYPVNFMPGLGYPHS